MKYVLIDSRHKEKYYSIKPIIEDEELINARFTFWANMNNLAMQNMMIQKRKL